MESIEEIMKLLHKKRTIREEQYAKMEKEQITEYNNLMNTLQTIKDERNDCKESITKNLQRLNTYKHAIDKLIHGSENVPGLPVSHECHGQVISFLTEGIDFTNKLLNTYKNFDNSNKENNISSLNIIPDITSCTNTVGSELYEIKSLIAKVTTLHRSIDVLQEYCLVGSEEDLEI